MCSACLFNLRLGEQCTSQPLLDTESIAKDVQQFIHFKFLNSDFYFGSREIAQWFRVQGPLAKDPGSIPNTHMVAQSHQSVTPLPGAVILSLLPPWAPGIHVLHLHTCSQYTHVY